MVEKRILEIMGHKVEVGVSSVDPLTKKYKAIANFQGLSQPIIVKDDVDKEVAINKAVSGLFPAPDREKLEFL